MSTSGWLAIAAPTVGPSPLTRLNTPEGTPAACRISVHTRAENGAISEGLSTIVQPTASAGATLQAIWFIGQFQGVKHRLVNLRSDIEVARALLRTATKDIALADPKRRVAAAQAAFWCQDKLKHVPEGGLQVFGGIGFTWEHDIHRTPAGSPRGRA